MRESFEQFVRDRGHGFMLGRKDNGLYDDSGVEAWWFFWQAAYGIGMNRAAVICQQKGERYGRLGATVSEAAANVFAEAIRAEIKESTS